MHSKISNVLAVASPIPVVLALFAIAGPAGAQ